MSMFHELMMRKKGMPSRYQEVEYIESTGTQYIDTGYIFTSEFGEVDMVAQLTQTSSTVSAFCGNIRSAIGRTFLVQQVNSNGIYFQTGVSPLNINSNISDTNKHHIRAVTSDKNYFYIDDTLIGNATKEGTIKNTENFVIFGRKADNSPVSNFAKMKLYSFKLYDNSVLVRNFIPVYDTETQKYGMWESVERKFYGNDGTGDFKGSIVGYTIVGSPTIVDGVVSGFSSSDYLYILSPKSVPTEIQSNNMKIKMKIKTPQQWSTANMFIIGYNHSVNSDSATLYDGGVYITTLGNLSIHTVIINSAQQPYIHLELDTIYYIAIETKGVFKMGISQDNVNWTYIQRDINKDKWYLKNRNIRIGRAATSAVQEFNGEIFINETSFVINNKLWFNGQQA